MMNNLFLMFDPSTNIYSMNWLCMALPLTLMNKNLYIKNNRFSTSMLMISKSIMKDTMQILKKNFYKLNILLMNFFIFIYMNNLISLNPFIFTATSHLSLTMFLSIPLWTALMLKSWFKNTSFMLEHMVPMGTPMILTPFMVVIETVSMLIRPFTLSIRLTANMIAGHILIALLSTLLNSNFAIFMATSIIVNTLMILETAVSLIQAYVFIILMTLYMSDTK